MQLKKSLWVSSVIVSILLLILATTTILLRVRPWHMSGEPILIDELKTINGDWLLLVQSYTGNWAEPYRVGLYVYERDINSWHWFYLAHQDAFWSSGRLRLDESARIVSIHNSSMAIAMICVAPEYTLEWLDGSKTGPQKTLTGGLEEKLAIEYQWQQLYLLLPKLREPAAPRSQAPGLGTHLSREALLRTAAAHGLNHALAKLELRRDWDYQAGAW